jgi:general secretion pathway protein K
MRSLHTSRKQQRGVAVVTALLLTTLAITIVASLFWQQQVQVRSIENQRLQLQKQWILRGALDWARVILRANAGKQNDNLDDPWAVPLEETRLDQYVENGRTDADASDATLSGNTIDAQGLFNLGNLVKNGAPNAGEVKMFEKLLNLLQLPPSLASATVKVMIAAQKPSVDAPDAPRPLDIRNVDDLLAVPGFTPEILDKLQKFVIVLPSDGATNTTLINVNTALAEVLAARIDTLTLSDANALVASRKQAYFRSREEFVARLNGKVPSPDERDHLDVKTNYFIVNGHVRLNRAGLSVRALIRRDQNAARVVWVRED